MTDQLTHILESGCQQLELTLSDTQTEQLIRYAQELNKWSKTYNLTAVRDIEGIIKRHVLDALSVAKSIERLAPITLADIGTGGGVPGIILAIFFPELRVYLVESTGKKCRFLRHIVPILGLSERVDIVQQRVEEWQIDTPLSIVICRAFTSLEKFTTVTRHLGDNNSTWLAMKAENTAGEVALLPNDFNITNDERLNVPFEAAARHLLTIKKNALPN